MQPKTVKIAIALGLALVCLATLRVILPPDHADPVVMKPLPEVQSTSLEHHVSGLEAQKFQLYLQIQRLRLHLVATRMLVVTYLSLLALCVCVYLCNFSKLNVVFVSTFGEGQD